MTLTLLLDFVIFIFNDYVALLYENSTALNLKEPPIPLLLVSQHYFIDKLLFEFNTEVSIKVWDLYLRFVLARVCHND